MGSSEIETNHTTILDTVKTFCKPVQSNQFFMQMPNFNDLKSYLETCKYKMF